MLLSLGFVFLIAAVAGAFDPAQRQSPPPPPSAPAGSGASLVVQFPPSTPPGLVVMFETQASTAFVAPATFTFGSAALDQARAEVATIAGVSTSDVQVVARPLNQTSGSGGRRLSELDTANCTVGAGQSLFALDFTVAVRDASVFDTILAQILARLSGLTNPADGADTAEQCSEPGWASTDPCSARRRRRRRRRPRYRWCSPSLWRSTRRCASNAPTRRVASASPRASPASRRRTCASTAIR